MENIFFFLFFNTNGCMMHATVKDALSQNAKLK